MRLLKNDASPPERDGLEAGPSALVTNIQGCSIHDGPGIRTVVFLKGCGLECWWCSNPECVSGEREVGFLPYLCAQCGGCGGACPTGALSSGPGRLPVVDRALCSACGECAAACTRGARVVYGRQMTVSEVFGAVERDRMFYEASGGGITVSGGEPLLQPRFVGALFETCRGAGIHTCLETCGHAARSAFRQVLPYTDYVLFDLKLMSASEHLTYTGKSNGRVLANARLVARSGVELLFRMPLIPGVNDSAENLRQTATFLHQLEDGAPCLQLMPYHRLGMGKYQSLGRQYRLEGLEPPTQDQLDRVRKTFADGGVTCTISE